MHVFLHVYIPNAVFEPLNAISTERFKTISLIFQLSLAPSLHRDPPAPTFIMYLLSYITLSIALLFCTINDVYTQCSLDNNIVSVSQYIGSLTAGGTNGDADAATFQNLYGIASDLHGSLYLTDHGNCALRRIIRSDPQNPVAETYLGGVCTNTVQQGDQIGDGSFKIGDGNDFTDITFVNTTAGDFLYLLGFDNVRQIDVSDPSQPVLGYIDGDGDLASPYAGTSSAGTAEGARGVGQVSNPKAVVAAGNGVGTAIFGEGTLLIADGGSNQLRQVAIDGSITAWSGVEGGTGLPQNGNDGSDASYIGLRGIAFDDKENVYVCDMNGLSNTVLIRRILSDGGGFTPDGPQEHFLGGSPGQCDGVAEEVKFKEPKRIVRDPEEGFFLFIDEYLIRRLVITDADKGKVSTLAGSTNSFSDGVGRDASFRNPRSLAIVGNTVFVACDTYVSAIEFVPPSVPDDPEVLSTNSTYATVQFANSQYDGGPLFQAYRFTIENTNTGQVHETFDIYQDIDATIPDYNFTGLTPGSTYEVYSQGVNRVGLSAPSTKQTFTTPLSCFGIQFNLPSVCSGYGTCTGFDVCDCDDGYSQDDCSIFDCYGVDSKNETTCSGHGNCVSPDNCDCETGYLGDQCEIIECFGDLSNGSTVCGAHGECVAYDDCSCDTGYSGNECGEFECYGIRFDSTDPAPCSGNGTCTDADTCSCNEFYVGDECDTFQPECFGKVTTNACGGTDRGVCVSEDKCDCETGYLGDECQYFTCFSKNASDTDVCSGHGECLNLDFCSCDDGWTDAQCNNIVCYDVSEAHPDVCSGHGQCVSFDECDCDNDGATFFGSYCNSSLYNSFFVTPVTGNLLETSFNFVPLSYAFPSDSDFTYSFYYYDTTLDLKIFIGTSNDQFVYPPVSGQILLGADIDTPKGTASSNFTVIVEPTSSNLLQNKEELLQDETISYNLRQFYKRRCDTRSYLANLIFFNSSASVAYQCSDPDFNIEESDFSYYANYEQELFASDDSACSLEEEFRTSTSDHTPLTLSIHSRIAECISRNTRDPQYIVSHLQDQIMDVSPSDFKEDTTQRLLQTTSNLASYIQSQSAALATQSQAISNNLLDILTQLSLKMEGFTQSGSTFTVLSSHNAHVAFAYGPYSNMIGSSITYQIQANQRSVSIQLPTSSLSPPTPSTEIKLGAYVLEYDPYQWESFEVSPNISSVLVNIAVYTSSGALPIQSSTDSVRVKVPGSYQVSSKRDTSSDPTYACVMWQASDGAWTDEDCTLDDSTSSQFSMTCECSRVSGPVAISRRASQGSDSPQDPVQPTGQEFVGWVETNWKLLAGVGVGLLVLILGFTCCLLFCLIFFICCTRKMSKQSRTVQPNFKGVYPAEYHHSGASQDSSAESDMRISQGTSKSHSPEGKSKRTQKKFEELRVRMLHGENQSGMDHAGYPENDPDGLDIEDVQDDFETPRKPKDEPSFHTAKSYRAGDSSQALDTPQKSDSEFETPKKGETQENGKDAQKGLSGLDDNALLRSNPFTSKKAGESQARFSEHQLEQLKEMQQQIQQGKQNGFSQEQMQLFQRMQQMGGYMPYGQNPMNMQQPQQDQQNQQQNTNDNQNAEILRQLEELRNKNKGNDQNAELMKQLEELKNQSHNNQNNDNQNSEIMKQLAELKSQNQNNQNNSNGMDQLNQLIAAQKELASLSQPAPSPEKKSKKKKGKKGKKKGKKGKKKGKKGKKK